MPTACAWSVYRKLAAASSDDEVASVTPRSLTAMASRPRRPSASRRLPCLRLRAREHGVTEIGVTGSQVRISPFTLPDSLQVRLQRLYLSATYRPTTSTVAVPIPKAGGGSARCATMS